MNFSIHRNEKELYFKKLFEDYYAPFCLYAKRFILEREEREDIVSEVFLNVWKKIEANNFNKDSDIEYIRLAVRNQCLNHIKHQEYVIDYTAWMQQKSVIYAASPDTIYTLEELYSLLSDILKKLPEEYRTVFVNCFLHERKQAEVAKEMNVSIKTINRYKKKIQQILQKDLKDYMLLLFLLTV